MKRYIAVLELEAEEESIDVNVRFMYRKNGTNYARYESVVFKEEKEGHWIDNHNGTISCSSCQTWFHKDDRYSYMHYCPNCNVKMTESENK